MIQIPSILTGFSTRLDGGASLRFSTNELSDDDVLELKRHQGQFGFLLFKESRFSESDIPREDAVDETKTPSKRLRGVLYRVWQHRGVTVDFETYYRGIIEEYISRLKEQLDD